MTTDSGPTTGRSHPTAILAIILISYFMILLDNSIIFTGLPNIQAELGYSATGLSWVQDAYTLVFGGLLLLGARLGDLFGRRRVFVAGLAVFAASSFLVGAAATDWWLIAARALQGVGAAVVAPASLSLLTASFPAGRERTRAVAWYGAAAGIGASIGLVIGGALADWVSWRAGFFINVPIGIAMIVLAPRFLPETEPRTGRFDITGAVCATLGMATLVFGIVNTADAGWGAPVTLVTLAVGALLLALLVRNEARAEQPIMPLRLFLSRERSGAYAARMLYLGAMIGFFYFTTQLLQGVMGFSAFQAGVAFFPMTVVNFIVAMAIPRLTPRFGNATLLATGVTLTLAGMAWLSLVHPASTYLTAVALPMVLIGAGQGLAFAPLTAAGIAGVTARDAGAASGLVNTAHQLGSALGLGILVTVSATAGATEDDPARVLTAHISAALTGGTVLLALCLLVVLALIVPSAARRTLDRTSIDLTTASVNQKA
ncbi:MAG: MFS transporter [Rhodococcus sp. (in: high G+C Gram-positive bacteria)]|nr:MAG: MFS transporter [Rhodococcus sp. (in: high G+C Gram-positive bacteria)]